MTIADALLNEFEQESQTTRKFLERLPEAGLNWKPHEKSMTAGQLALHIATAPGGVVRMAQEDKVPAPEFGRPRPQPGSVREVLDALDQSIATVREVLPTFSDARMQETWTATKDGKDLLSMPRASLLRSILLNHWYHHRGQFGVYLRLLGAKVPSSYGPSGDEVPDFMRGA